jgi:hypothetical protein
VNVEIAGFSDVTPRRWYVVRDVSRERVAAMLKP